MMRESKYRFFSVRHIFTIVITIMVCNCSTPYKPKGALGGFSSNQLNENNYEVSFKGNQHTIAETVFDYLLRRCAEITIEENGKYFIVYEDSSYVDKTVVETGPDLDQQLDQFQNSGRADNYLLNRKPVITRDPIQIILNDHHSKIGRTYSYMTIDSDATNVVGVYKIQIFEEQIEGYEDYFFSALDILEKFNGK